MFFFQTIGGNFSVSNHGSSSCFDSVHTLIPADLLEVADLAGARRFEVLIDERQHAAQSLLNPGLAACQGPAVAVFFDVELRRVGDEMS